MVKRKRARRQPTIEGAARPARPRRDPAAIGSKDLFVLGVLAGALAGKHEWHATMKVTLRAHGIADKCFAGIKDDDDELMHRCQGFLAWYFGYGPAPLPSWVVWEKGKGPTDV